MTERKLARLHELLDGRDSLKRPNLLDISHWRETCDVTLTLKQALKSHDGRWVKIDQYQCRRAFRHFMNLLNRAVYGNAAHRHGKRVRVIPVLEKAALPVQAISLTSRGQSKITGRWHFHCAVELPAHIDATELERLVSNCWAKVHWSYRRTLTRDGANCGWIKYMLKPWQKSEFDDWSDCIDWENLHNPIADA